MQISKRTGETGAPRQTEIMGQPHMLAYINEAERQMLKRAGGAEAPGPEGIPAYYKWNEPSSWFDGNPAGTTDKDFPSDKHYQAQAGSVDNATPGPIDSLLMGFGLKKRTAGYDAATAKNLGNQQAEQDKINNQHPTANDDNNDPGTNAGGGGSDGNPGVTTVTSAPPINQALLDARARRDAALAAQMGNLGSAFGFATDDYYTGLGTSYRDGGLSESFTTAYDDATRGIYDTFKSAGMLTQQGVDDSMGILAGAKGGEEGRIDSIVDNYTNANRNYVTGGRDTITAELQALSSPSDDIGTIDTQTAQITGFDVPGRVLPYKTPEEQEVADFFTDFAKRSYDPSYNVDPSAVASGGPKRVSNSVDKLGAGTQPSTIAGILDPVAGGSVRVVG